MNRVEAEIRFGESERPWSGTGEARRMGTREERRREGKRWVGRRCIVIQDGRERSSQSIWGGRDWRRRG